jgi:hypothetical protein
MNGSPRKLGDGNEQRWEDGVGRRGGRTIRD